ncbi:hypothetical protein KIH39_06305 [Telmatocola sphagniphila]|uniref:Alpha/beta hydrolase family protein n=1 Tax=Telmatocola sphagniphila TaxID=1123043 RepID=A0A8E6EZA1_9BACT|nr:hypothetical protein [Telmatocola sphagniphila]QVL33518.1 hypothetical protein KIH39_06305 [Telmatocola sphagniphila]
MLSLLLSTLLLFKPAEALPNTQLLTESRDLARVMVDGIHSYLDKYSGKLILERQRDWHFDSSNPESLRRSLELQRQELKKILGVVDSRRPPLLEYIVGPNAPELIAESERVRIYRVRWAVLSGIDAEGLLLQPKKTIIADAIAIGHTEDSPEQIAGLNGSSKSEVPFALRLAENNFRVLVPYLIDTHDDFSGNARLNRWTNQSHREFIHRMSYEMGRTTLGFEIQKCLAGADWFAIQPEKVPIIVVGTGIGGLIAQYSASIDPRIQMVGIQGGLSENAPLDLNFWDSGSYLGSVSKLLPKQIVFGNAPDRTFQFPAARAGRNGASPPSKYRTPIESLRLIETVKNQTKDPIWGAYLGTLLKTPRKSSEVADWIPLLRKLKSGVSDSPWIEASESLSDHRSPKLREQETADRARRQFDQMVSFVQQLWRNSEPVRQDYWKAADASSPEAWEKSCESYRKYFHEETIGKLREPKVPLNPRSRKSYDTPGYSGYEIVLDVCPEIIANGILLLPKNLKKDERRPVVVCQHGLNGRASSCIEKEKRVIYNQFAAKLVEQGYIVYCPQNPYIFEDDFRQLLRKANPLKLSLFSFIIEQHSRTIDWLETLPNVDPRRIAFYGLSYGGKTAMRVPAVEKRYCLSICSGDFNEWIGKIVSTDLPMSYMFTNEYDMLEFNMGNKFNYAEMANLIAPRPFMVERGHDDGVGIDPMIAYEYAKVRYLYANKLKISDNTQIEFFPGGHQIHGVRTFEFLRKHLHYPQ